MKGKDEKENMEFLRVVLVIAARTLRRRDGSESGWTGRV